MMEVVTPIRPEFPPDDMVAILRRTADDVEAGKWGLITTCLIVLGHTAIRPGDGEQICESTCELIGCGPRCDTFTVRGLLLTASRK